MDPRDPLTLIVAALAAGAAAAARRVAGQAIQDRAIQDGYTQLKTLLIRKFGPTSDVENAVQNVEKRPDSVGRRSTLKEELQVANADKDAGVMQAARALLALLNAAGLAGGTSDQATLSGSGAIAQGPNASAAGAGGVVAHGDVHGDINTGTHIDTGGGAYIGGNVSTQGGSFVARDQTINNYYGNTPESAAGIASTPEGRKLGNLLDGYFNLGDIEGLCFEMGIDDQNLRGQTKVEKARALVQHCEVTGRLAELKRLMRVQRPNLRDQLQ